MDVAIVIPLFNQLDYTKICLESLIPTVGDEVSILVVNNGSSDGTGEYLRSCSRIEVIENEKNLGCSGAWNQGVRATSSQWVVILNNDVILPPGWLEGLIDFAIETGTDVASPALREGEHNYDLDSYSQEFIQRMRHVSRPGEAHGICFLVNRRVFEEIGLFDEKFRIGQFEDADFFRRSRLAGFRLGTTGRSFIHHFGSVTQDRIRHERAEPPYVAENRAYYRAKWDLTPWRRFMERRQRKLRETYWRLRERWSCGHTLREKWIEGRLRYY